MKTQITYQNKISTLYLLGTPIGNLGEISSNIIQLLKKIPVVFCEDTRTSQKIFDKHGIVKQKYSFHKFNEQTHWKKILDHLKKGEDVALMSCAGVPLIADPGFGLVQKVLAANFNVTALGINSAFLIALICSGLAIEKFTFLSFLKATEKQKIKQIQEMLKLSETIVCYESVHRIKKTMLLLQKMAPERTFCLAREISKKYETFYRGTFQELKIKDITWKGEFVLVVNGINDYDKKNLNLKGFLDKIKAFNLNKKQILMIGKNIFGFKRKDLYEVLYRNKHKQNNK